MNNQSSGCYVIDSEYNVINVNETAAKLYPQLATGKKCYTCLMGLNEPCPPCPVAGGRKGPATYIDPIRHISEIVDAVDITVEGHGLCHALVFATVEQEAAFAATLPTTAEGLKNLALIKALTMDYYDVFSVDLTDGSMLMYRHNRIALDENSVYRQIMSYEEGIASHIATHIYQEDQEMLREKTSLPYLKEALKKTESLVLHYRAVWKGEVHYFYRRIVRIGDPDSFDNLVVGVGCEDEEVAEQQKQAALQNTLRKVEISNTTGLLTKEAFFIYVDKMFQNYSEDLFDFCMVRIDNLESINRQYGRVVRKKVLQNLADLLKEYEQEKNKIAYLGEGAFASFSETLSSQTRKAQIAEFVERLRERSEIQNVVYKWITYRNVNRSISAEEIYRKVMYISSTMNTHDEYTELDQNMLDRMDWDLSVERLFHQALQNGEFTAWYQPKYSVHTQEVIGAEALVRWILPNGEMIPPNKFIPVLENCGLINRLDEEIFRQVCELQKYLEEQGKKKIPISVNLSRASLFIRDIPESYLKIAEEFDVEPKRVPIEITESAAVRAAMIGAFAKELIDRGFVLHMDDFGAGYSSLASLQSIPFETIKMDKSLIDFIGTRNGESILKHTIAFAKEGGMKVIAEGVETLEQFMFLKVAGCDGIQGYYFSKPLKKEEFLKLL